MEITEVRVKLMEDTDDRLQAFCSLTFDNAFVVRDLKIIEGSNGPFVAMPSRKLTSHCHLCKAKNHLRAVYCNQCGTKQRDDRLHRDPEGRAKLYADIAHPINSSCREMIQTRVIQEFLSERERSKQPGYISRYDEDYAFDAGEEFDLPREEFSGDDPARISRASESRTAESRAAESRTAETRVDSPHSNVETQGPHRTAPESAPVGTTPAPHSKPVRGQGGFGAGIFE